jgi:ribosomal protein S12 methylthiotransferase
VPSTPPEPAAVHAPGSPAPDDGRAGRRAVSVVTLGCARNEVDSEELAARLASGGWELAADGEDASVVMVNTCGFIQAAKQESIDELLSAAESGAKVAAVGCLAERYGNELADALPEAQILSFDDYGDIAARLDDVLNGRRKAPHTPRDRRTLLPLSPADRAAPGAGSGPSAARTAAPAAATAASAPGNRPSGAGTGDLPAGVAPPSGPRPMRRRLSHGVVAPLKIASGCDRRCSFCAIPAFRGAYLSRRPHELLAEAGWLAGEGVRELFLVSENSTSYGKDLGNLRLLEEVLPSLAATPGIVRVRLSYLQPAELRPGLIEAIAGTPGVAPYFDLSFQHASGPLLRAMRRFGDRKRFLDLIDRIRTVSPKAGIRSNFIVGFPGETAQDLHELELFLSGARLDAIGVFGYSDEDGTEAASLPGKLDQAEVARRVEEVADLAEELMAQRGADRIGETVEVLIEERLGDGLFEGRAAHQAPEVDGATTVQARADLVPGQLVQATVVSSDGVDLVAPAVVPSGAGGATELLAPRLLADRH